jgi:hypothetical protein
MEVEWFPCVHEVGTAEVEWYVPLEPPKEYSLESHLQVEEYCGKWKIPKRPARGGILNYSEEHEWKRGDASSSAFFVTLAREITCISTRNLPYEQVIGTVAAKYPFFLAQENIADSPLARARFRVCLWMLARANKFEIL